MATAYTSGLQIVSTAPTRIDVGAPTDVPQILKIENINGIIFNGAITPRAYVTIKTRINRSITLNSVDYNRSETYTNLEELQASNKPDLLKAAVLSVAPTGGFELVANVGLPLGSGLGASGAVAVAALSALYTLQNGSIHSIDPETLAEEAIRLEADYLGNTGGSQDQYAAAIGGFNSFLYRGNIFKRDQLLIDPMVIKALEDRLIIVYSGISRLSSQLHNRVISAYKSGDSKVRYDLQRIVSLTEQVIKAIMQGDIDLFGMLIAEIWTAQSSLAEGITTDGIEHILQFTKQQGAIGGKALGAGGGGCVLIVCSDGKKGEIVTLLRKRYRIIPFKFSKLGVHTTIKDISQKIG